MELICTCFRKNFDIHTGKYFDIMLFVFNSDVFSFLIDWVHPRSIPSAALFISDSGTTNWLCQSPLEEILEGGQRLHYVSWIMTRPGWAPASTITSLAASPSPSNQYLLALASSLLCKLAHIFCPRAPQNRSPNFSEVLTWCMAGSPWCIQKS